MNNLHTPHIVGAKNTCSLARRFLTAGAGALLLLCASNSMATPIADSIRDYSETQGNNGWSYGQGIGSEFTSDGWTFTEGRWESPDGQNIGKAFIGRYPEPFDYKVSYNQVFWDSHATATVAWKSDGDYSGGTVKVRMFFPSAGGLPVRIRVFVNDQTLLDETVDSDSTRDWFDAVSLPLDIKKNDVIYVGISSTGNNSDFTNHGMQVIINN